MTVTVFFAKKYFRDGMRQLFRYWMNIIVGEVKGSIWKGDCINERIDGGIFV